jgi:hypothetical protein
METRRDRSLKRVLGGNFKRSLKSSWRDGEKERNRPLKIHDGKEKEKDRPLKSSWREGERERPSSKEFMAGRRGGKTVL